VAFIGQLDQKNARVAELSDLAQGLDLAGTSISRAAYFCHAVDDVGDFFAKWTGKFITNDIQAFTLVLDHIMQ